MVLRFFFVFKLTIHYKNKRLLGGVNDKKL